MQLEGKISKFIIWGQKPLKGQIEVFGAKNAAMKMMAASILIKGRVILENVPDILDIQKIILILKKMGGRIQRQGHQLLIDLRNLRAENPDPDLVRTMRASVVLVGPLLARFGKVAIPHPGGCIIGARPIDLHLKAFRDLGVQVKENKDSYEFHSSGKLTDKASFPKISVTATENVLLFASALEKPITITGVAIEPEVKDLIEFLKKSGVKFKVTGRKITVRGSKNLKPVRYRVMPDRIEAGTLAILGATTKSNLKITHLNPNHLANLLDKFKKINLPFEKGKNFLEIKKPGQMRAVKIATAEYPGFPTDLQSPMGVLLTQAQGRSRIRENIFEHRLEYLKVLKMMGAKVKFLSNREAEIMGPTELCGRRIESLDLRSGASLIIAGLIARGKTEILDAEIIDRGYEKIEERLQKVGADIQRVT